MEGKIKKLVELMKQLNKLLLKVLEFLSFLTLAEITVKGMIQIWNKL